MDAVPAVMASTWEWISCLDSSILFLRQAWEALNEAEKTMTIQICFALLKCDVVMLGIGYQKLTASVPSGGRASRSSREACAAWTACMLELMVPVRACCAEVWRHGMIYYNTSFLDWKKILWTQFKKEKNELKMNWFLSSNLFSLPRNVLEVRRDITDLPAEACALGASVHWWCAAWPEAWSPSGNSLDLQHLNAWWQAEPPSLFPPSPCD